MKKRLSWMHTTGCAASLWVVLMSVGCASQMDEARFTRQGEAFARGRDDRADTDELRPCEKEGWEQEQRYWEDQREYHRAH